MEIDFNRAPPDATHYMTQRNNDRVYWFLNEEGDYIKTILVNSGKEFLHRGQDVKMFLQGEYYCTCYPLVFSLENE